MVKRCCPKCNTVFYRKSNFDYHINKKFNCIQNINSDINMINSIDKDDDICKNLQEFAGICKNLQKFAKICKNEKIVQKNEKIDDKKINSINLNNQSNVLNEFEQFVIPNQTIAKK